MELARGQSLEQVMRSESGAATRLVLFYGPDLGQISEKSRLLLQSLNIKTDNDFQLSRLTGADLAENPGRLRMDVSSQCLTGERRVVWISSAGEGNKGGSQILAWLKELATDAKLAAKNKSGTGFSGNPPMESLVIAELGDLPARSPLRTALKSSPFAIAVACYADNERDLMSLIKEQLSREKITITEDALRALAGNLGSDRLSTRNEVEKLALYAGPGGRLDLNDILALNGDSASLSIDTLIGDAAQGLVDRLDKNWQRAVAEGENGVALIRAALRYFQRLDIIVSRVATGMAARQAVAAHKPPIFWRDVDRMVLLASIWTPRTIHLILTGLLEAEQQCKTSDYADLVIAGWHYNRIAAAGMSLRRKSASAN